MSAGQRTEFMVVIAAERGAHSRSMALSKAAQEEVQNKFTQMQLLMFKSHLLHHAMLPCIEMGRQFPVIKRDLYSCTWYTSI